MAEGVLLSPDQLPSCQPEPGTLVRSHEERKVVKKVDNLHLEEATVGGEPDSAGSTDDEGKWNTPATYIQKAELAGVKNMQIVKDFPQINNWRMQKLSFSLFLDPTLPFPLN